MKITPNRKRYNLTVYCSKRVLVNSYQKHTKMNVEENLILIWKKIILITKFNKK